MLLLALRYEMRTDTVQGGFIDMIKTAQAAGDTAREEELSKMYSTYGVTPALRGQHNWGTDAGESFQLYAYEAMHNEDLGVFLYLVDNMQPAIAAALGGSEAAKRRATQLTKTMSQNFGQLPRAEDFAPPWCRGDYINGHSKVQAKEHRDAMQGMPHVSTVLLQPGVRNEAIERVVRLQCR